MPGIGVWRYAEESANKMMQKEQLSIAGGSAIGG